MTNGFKEYPDDFKRDRHFLMNTAGCILGLFLTYLKDSKKKQYYFINVFFSFSRRLTFQKKC